MIERLREWLKRLWDPEAVEMRRIIERHWLRQQMDRVPDARGNLWRPGD